MTPDFYARLAAAPVLIDDRTPEERAVMAATARRLLDRMRAHVKTNIAAFISALRRTLVAQALREMGVSR